MDRKAAKNAGLRFYAGSACSRGHNGIRYVSTGNCYHCILENKAERLSERTFRGPAKDLDFLTEIWTAMQAARQQARPQDPRLPRAWPTPAPAPDPSDPDD